MEKSFHLAKAQVNDKSIKCNGNNRSLAKKESKISQLSPPMFMVFKKEDIPESVSEDYVKDILKFKNRIAAKKHRHKKAYYYNNLIGENDFLKKTLASLIKQDKKYAKKILREDFEKVLDILDIDIVPEDEINEENKTNNEKKTVELENHSSFNIFSSTAAPNDDELYSCVDFDKSTDLHSLEYLESPFSDGFLLGKKRCRMVSDPETLSLNESGIEIKENEEMQLLIETASTKLKKMTKMNEEAKKKNNKKSEAPSTKFKTECIPKRMRAFTDSALNSHSVTDSQKGFLSFNTAEDLQYSKTLSNSQGGKTLNVLEYLELESSKNSALVSYQNQNKPIFCSEMQDDVALSALKTPCLYEDDDEHETKFYKSLFSYQN